MPIIFLFKDDEICRPRDKNALYLTLIFFYLFLNQNISCGFSYVVGTQMNHLNEMFFLITKSTIFKLIMDKEMITKYAKTFAGPMLYVFGTISVPSVRWFGTSDRTTEIRQ